MHAAYTTAAILARLVAEFVAKCGETVLVIEQYDADYAQETGGSGQSVTRSTVATEIDILKHDRYGREDLNNIVRDKNPLDCLVGMLADYYGEWGGARVSTLDDYNERKAREERQRIDAAAKAFAAQVGCEVGTMELLDALDEAINRAQYTREVEMGDECMAEDYAAHVAAGCTSEFWSNRDYTRNQCDKAVERVEEIMAWMEKNVPMTVALWREQKIQAEAE